MSYLTTLAPGVGALAGGYVKGTAATQDKLREEQIQRDKEAMNYSLRLLEQGWQPVDPNSGAAQGQVLKVGNQFLVPPPFTKRDEAEYKMRELEQRLEIGKMNVEAQQEELKQMLKRGQLSEREFELRMGLLEKERLARIEEINERNRREGEKNFGTVYLVDDEGNDIAVTPSNRVKETIEILKGQGVKASVGKRVGRPPTAKEILDMQSNIEVKRISLLQTAKEASSSEIVKEVVNGLNLLNDDNSTLYYTYEPGFTRWGSGKVVTAVVPKKAVKGVGWVPATYGDFRIMARQLGISVEDAIAKAKQNYEKEEKEAKATMPSRVKPPIPPAPPTRKLPVS